MPETEEWELVVGDVLQLIHGPFTSDWKVVEIAEHGAILEYDGGLQLTGFEHLLTAPNGTELTRKLGQEFIGRSHWASAIRRNWPGHTGLG